MYRRCRNQIFSRTVYRSLLSNHFFPVMYTLLSMTVTTISVICTVIVLYLHHNQSKSHPPNWILSIAKSVHFEFRSKPSGNKEVALDDNISSLNIEEESVPVKTIITMTSLDEWRLVASILDRMLFSLSFILLLLSLVYSMFTISMSPSHL